MIKRICVFLLIIIFLNLSVYSKENIYIFLNKNYINVFSENLKIINLIKNNFKKNNYLIKEIKFNSFKTVQYEIEKINLNNYKGIIFSDYLISPIIFKNDNISKNNNIKLITYNLPENYKFEVSLPVFNIVFDSSIYKIKIEKILKQFSNKKDLSDCGIIINSNYSICSKIINDFNDNGYKILVFDIENDTNNLNLWLENNKNLKNIIFFGYNKNIQIQNISDEYKKKNFFEINSNYGKNLPYVKKNMQIIWEKVINYAIKSKNFNDFIKNKSLKNEIIDFIVNKEDIIIVK